MSHFLSSRLPRSLDQLFYKVLAKTYTPVFFRIDVGEVIFNHEIQPYSDYEISQHEVQRRLILVKNEQQLCVNFENRTEDEQTLSNNSCIFDDFSKYNLLFNFDSIRSNLFKYESAFPVIICAKKADKVSQLYFEYGLPDFFQ